MAGRVNDMEYNTANAMQAGNHDVNAHQSRWFSVSGDIDDFIFFDETEDGYEHTYISEK